MPKLILVTKCVCLQCRAPKIESTMVSRSSIAQGQALVCKWRTGALKLDRGSRLGVGDRFSVFWRQLFRQVQGMSNMPLPNGTAQPISTRFLLGRVAWSLCLSRAGSETKPRFQVWYSTAGSVICNHRNRTFLLLFLPCQQFLGG